MATGAPNAILAINSLDRYTATVVTTISQFQATWAAAATVLTLSTVAPPYQFPVLGGVLSAAGLAANTIITAINGNQITINNATTGAAVTVRAVTQSVSRGSANQPISTSLFGAYTNVTPYSYDFQIGRPNSLINGYIQRIVVSQAQIQYNIPTVNLGKNDKFYIFSSVAGTTFSFTIPYGFYSPQELAAALQILIQVNIADMTVTYDTNKKFTFTSALTQFFFPGPEDLTAGAVIILTSEEKNTLYRTLRMLGMTANNAAAGGPKNTQESFDYPNFLYTPYIDFYSNVLTNYQSLKDTDTSLSNRKSLIARVYLSGMGSGVITTDTAALGTSAFVMTADMNSPKIIEWSPDSAVPSIDFQLRDCYDEFLPGAPYGYSTEWQMTLLCVEGRQWKS